MLETKDLILAKAKFSDWEDMLHNVWSHPVCAQYMYWQVTTDPESAKQRMERTIAFQKAHNTYLVYEKATGRAIGFAGVESFDPDICMETGICLGPAYQRRGYGKQILRCLMDYGKTHLKARTFLYFTREENQPSIALARSLGFTFVSAEEKLDEKTGLPYQMQKYSASLI